MKWHEWRGSLDGRPTMLTRTLLRAFGCRLVLHKFVGTDDPGCFHTHPAYAVRIILRGAYIEQLEDGTYRLWQTGDVGIVRPTLPHRIDQASASPQPLTLWLRGPKVAETQLRGDGWAR